MAPPRARPAKIGARVERLGSPGGPAASSTPGHRRTGPGPAGLVGRDTELARLGELLRRDQPVVVDGEAGIGKTSLIRAAVSEAGRIAVEVIGFATLAERQHAALRRILGGAIDGDALFLASLIERRVGPDVLVVDDLQWLDAGTRGVVAQLVGRVTIVMAVRTGTGGTEAALELAARAGCERVDLEPLGLEAGIELVRRRSSDLAAPEAARIARRAGGNPFFLLELAAAGSATAGSDLVIRRRLAELDAEALESARRLAVLGRPAMPTELGPGVDALVRSGVAMSSDGSIAVRHQLLAEHVLASLGPDDLVRLRGELARDTADPLEAARLFLAAGDRASAGLAAEAAEAAAATVGDGIEALRLRAEAASGDDAHSLRIEAATRLVEVHDYAGAARLLDGLEGRDEVSAVRLSALRARIEGVTGRYAAAAAIIDQVDPRARTLAAAGHPDGNRLLVDILASHAQIRGWTGDPAGGLALAEEAVRLADATAEGAVRARTLLGYLLVTCDRPGEAIGPLSDAAARARASGDGPAELQGLNVLLLAQISAIGSGPALATCELMVERATTLRLYGTRDSLRSYHVFVLDAAGRYHDAIEVASDLATSLSARAQIYGPAYSALALSRVGRFDAARSLLARLEPLRGTDPEADRAYFDVGSAIELAQGRSAAALQLIESNLAMAHKGEADTIELGLNAMWAKWELGRDPGMAIDPGPTARVAGVGSESRALVLMAAGDHLAAADAFAVAAQAWTPFFAWNADRCRWGRGEALRRAGRTDEALEVLLAAERVALERDARPQLARVQRSLRLLGVRRAAPRLPAGRDLLTARERELVELVAAGDSNAEIGRRLGLGRGTVHRLLSSAMGKLGAETRSQAVALLERI